MSVVLKKPAVVWKRCDNAKGAPVLVKLLLPKGTRCRFNPTDPHRSTGKNRSDRARVLAIYTLSYWRSDRNGLHRAILGRSNATCAYSCLYNGTYRVGKLERPDGFTRGDHVCARGLHFFSDKRTAQDYN